MYKDSFEIGISGWGSISALGVAKEDIFKELLSPESKALKNSSDNWVVPLASHTQALTRKLVTEHRVHRKTDRVVHLGLLAAQEAVAMANWNDTDFGINVGSSRGATELWETYHGHFQEAQEAMLNSSPATTSGNISYWLGQHFKQKGIAFSHSITCSSSFHSILNAIAWLRSGMADRFLAGGSEAPLTPFTVAQMKALKIYSSLEENYPTRPMSSHKGGMILGEGSGIFALERKSASSKAFISGMGWSTEGIDSPTSISAAGEALEKSMKMALKNHELSDVDAVVLHAPGNRRGDEAEGNALKKVFGNKTPAFTSNKWKIGHLLGASGALSLEMALQMITHNQFFQIPYIDYPRLPERIENVLVNSTGFGGNAVSFLISKNRP